MYCGYEENITAFQFADTPSAREFKTTGEPVLFPNAETKPQQQMESLAHYPVSVDALRRSADYMHAYERISSAAGNNREKSWEGLQEERGRKTIAQKSGWFPQPKNEEAQHQFSCHQAHQGFHIFRSSFSQPMPKEWHKAIDAKA